MARLRLIALTLVLLCLSLQAPASGQAGITLAQIAAVAGALQLVKPALDESVNNAGNQADQFTRNAQTRVTALLGELKKLSADTEGRFATQREDTTKQAFSLLREIYQYSQSARLKLAVDVYRGLAGAAAILDAIPFVNIPDTPFSALPLALREGSPDRRVRVYGYFPNVNANNRAIVTLPGGKELTALRGIGTLEWDLPKDLTAKGGVFIDLSVRIPGGLVDRTLGQWFDTFKSRTEFSARLAVLPKQPFNVSVTQLSRNEKGYRLVTGQHSDVGANSSSQTTSFVKGAQRWFEDSVAERAQYAVSSVTLARVDKADLGGGKPCSTCPDTSFSIGEDNPTMFSISVSAPNCGAHIVSAFNSCGGGGSNRTVRVTPVFSVRLNNEPEDVQLFSERLSLAENETRVIDLKPGWTLAQLVTVVSDGVSSRSDAAEVGNRELKPHLADSAAKGSWDAKVLSGNRLQISVHAIPVDPMTDH